ncbi:MAG: chemotaxis protein CheA [Acidobacteria bacterium]|nr:chemotaxis protein CheA [Acidobacteriota bacterium]
MTQFSDDPGAELRELFFETAQELLQHLNDDALNIEKTPANREIVRSMRRTIHTLKGDAAAAGFQELSELAHLLEDALAVEAFSENVSLAELGFTAADSFNAVLAACRQQAAMPDTSKLRSLVEQLTSGISGQGENGAKKPVSAGPQVAWTEYEKLAAYEAHSQGRNVFHIVAQIDPLCAMPIAARQLVANSLSAVAQVLGARPEPGSPPQGQAIELLVATSEEESVILAKCHIPTVITKAECFKAEIEAPLGQGARSVTADEPTAVEKAPEPEEMRASESTNPNRRSTSAETVLRVDAERIDTVLNLVGELIIGKSMLQQTVQEYSRRYPKDSLRSRFQDAMAIQSRVLNDLQRSVMKIRMVPVEQLFRRFPRIVRDAAQRCNKQVELVFSGQDTDLDKSLLDAIAEPLTHIVRNAVSHGLENAEERVRASKPPTGRIRLDACHQANQLIVEVSDDGSGIDVRKVKAKAIANGLLRAEEAERLSHTELLDLIFRPGFSTADEITEVSGRGVGLDVVRSVLHRLKGTVELETHPGKGTKFRLKLPLTLAIIKALLFRIDQRLYAIPLNAVAEIARARESDLHHVDSWEVLQLRGQVLPLMRLGQRPTGDLDQNQQKMFVLVVNFSGRKLGLIVDALVGEEELVLKALDDQTVATDLVTGASILGDGRVVLIMNLAAVVERFIGPGSEEASLDAYVPEASAIPTSARAEVGR